MTSVLSRGAPNRMLDRTRATSIPQRRDCRRQSSFIARRRPSIQQYTIPPGTPVSMTTLCVHTAKTIFPDHGRLVQTAGSVRWAHRDVSIRWPSIKAEKVVLGSTSLTQRCFGCGSCGATRWSCSRRTTQTWSFGMPITLRIPSWISRGSGLWCEGRRQLFDL